MSEKFSPDRRKFLKTLAAGAVGLVVDNVAISDLAWAKEMGEEKEAKPQTAGFLAREIEFLLEGLKDLKQKKFLKSELERIQELEAQKTMERRFSNSQKQMENYFSPFLQQQVEIIKAIGRADPQNKVPQEVVLGLVGMEGGGQSGTNPQTGAAGHYQLAKETAISLGLRADEKVDERYSLEHSTPAVLTYLKKLYESFGRQWGLALMAYSGGPGKLERRIRENFSLSDKEKFTPEMFKSKNINSVTLYSKHFKGLGKYHSIQYPFCVQFMAEKMKDLMRKKV